MARALLFEQSTSDTYNKEEGFSKGQGDRNFYTQNIPSDFTQATGTSGRYRMWNNTATVMAQIFPSRRKMMDKNEKNQMNIAYKLEPLEHQRTELLIL